jgi:hypothetical protein
MKIRPFIGCGVAEIALMAFFCGGRTAKTAVAQTPAPSGRTGLLDDLVLANRCWPPRNWGSWMRMDTSVSAAEAIPIIFYFAYVSPGIVTADDIIENDLDSNPVAGERSDQYQERFLHGEIYKARRDVMAIVHHIP